MGMTVSVSVALPLSLSLVVCTFLINKLFFTQMLLNTRRKLRETKLKLFEHQTKERTERGFLRLYGNQYDAYLTCTFVCRLSYYRQYAVKGILYAMTYLLYIYNFTTRFARSAGRCRSN